MCIFAMQAVYHSSFVTTLFLFFQIIVMPSSKAGSKETGDFLPGAVTRGKFRTSATTAKKPKRTVVLDETRNDMTMIPTAAEETAEERTKGEYRARWNSTADEARLATIAISEKKEAREGGMKKGEFYDQVSFSIDPFSFVDLFHLSPFTYYLCVLLQAVEISGKFTLPPKAAATAEPDANDLAATPAVASAAAVIASGSSYNARFDLRAAVNRLKEVKPELSEDYLAMAYIMRTTSYRSLPASSKFFRADDAARHINSERISRDFNGQIPVKLGVLASYARKEIEKIIGYTDTGI